MLEVRDDALEMMASMLNDSGVEEGQMLRLSANDQGTLGLSIDQPSAGDRVVAHHDRPVLVVEHSIDEQLDGTVLGVADEGQNQLMLQPKDGG